MSRKRIRMVRIPPNREVPVEDTGWTNFEDIKSSLLMTLIYESPTMLIFESHVYANGTSQLFIYLEEGESHGPLA